MRYQLPLFYFVQLVSEVKISCILSVFVFNCYRAVSAKTTTKRTLRCQDKKSIAAVLLKDRRPLSFLAI